jgi:hypothetical protein
MRRQLRPTSTKTLRMNRKKKLKLSAEVCFAEVMLQILA